MGNYTSTEVNTICENIDILINIGVRIKDKSYELNIDNRHYVISLYKTFYYPTHVLTKFDEMHSDHYHLRNKLKTIIRLYNKYNFTNIDEITYIKNSYKGLIPTLDSIDLYCGEE